MDKPDYSQEAIELLRALRLADKLKGEVDVYGFVGIENTKEHREAMYKRVNKLIREAELRALWEAEHRALWGGAPHDHEANSR